MKTSTDKITIGRDPELTFAIIRLVAERERRRLRRATLINKFSFPHRRINPEKGLTFLMKVVVLWVVLLIIWGFISILS